MENKNQNVISSKFTKEIVDTNKQELSSSEAAKYLKSMLYATAYGVAGGLLINLGTKLRNDYGLNIISSVSQVTGLVFCIDSCYRMIKNSIVLLKEKNTKPEVLNQYIDKSKA